MPLLRRGSFLYPIAYFLMQFSFEATVLATVNIQSRRTFEKTFDEHDIREWCEEQGIVKDGRELSEFAIEKYGKRMANEYFKSEDEDRNYAIQEDLREIAREYEPEISVEKVSFKNLSRFSKGKLSIAA
jgi:hypothetical protein